MSPDVKEPSKGDDDDTESSKGEAGGDYWDSDSESDNEELSKSKSLVELAQEAVSIEHDALLAPINYG